MLGVASRLGRFALIMDLNLEAASGHWEYRDIDHGGRAVLVIGTSLNFGCFSGVDQHVYRELAYKMS